MGEGCDKNQERKKLSCEKKIRGEMTHLRSIKEKETTLLSTPKTTKKDRPL
jgi:hypothetical protein